MGTGIEHPIELPPNVAKLLSSKLETEYATVSAAGVPIDTPTAFYAHDNFRRFDMGSGLSYPAKANRARNNPKVGLLIQGPPGEPVVSIAGMAAVRDTDIQANTDRYIAEAARHTLRLRSTNPEDDGQIPWDVAKKALYYWVRIMIEVTPKRILWWDNAEAMSGPPQRWDAPPDTVFPESDPAPKGPGTSAPQWPIDPWTDQAAHVMQLGLPGHLSLLDPEGHPLPFKVDNLSVTEDGFDFTVPTGVPWASRSGMASLSFLAVHTFVGQVTDTGSHLHMSVERPLPEIPFMKNFEELFWPAPSTYEALMGRLEKELARRGQPMPVLPDELPEPTPEQQRREARIEQEHADTISVDYLKGKS